MPHTGPTRDQHAPSRAGLWRPQHAPLVWAAQVGLQTLQGILPQVEGLLGGAPPGLRAPGDLAVSSPHLRPGAALRQGGSDC